MNRMKAFAKTPYFWLMLIFGVYFLLNLSMIDQGDDFCFNNIYRIKGDLFSFLQYYGNAWSGRLIPHGIMVLLFQLPPIIYQLVNAFFMTAVVFLGFRLCTGLTASFEAKEKFVLLGVAASVLYFPPAFMVSNAFFWKSANVLYIWGLAAAFTAVIPFVQAYLSQKTRALWWILAGIGAVYSSNFEQTAPFVLAFGIILMAMTYLEHKKVSLFHCLILLITGAGFVFSIKMPGNAFRFQAEVLEKMPHFDTFTFTDKIYLGFAYTFDFLYAHFPIFLFLISALALYLVFRSGQKIYIRVIAAIPTAYFSLLYFCSLAKGFFEKVHVPFGLDWGLFNFADFNTELVYFTLGQKLSLFFGILCFALLAVTIFLYVGKQKNTVSALLLAASFFTVFIMAFSPGVYASGQRVGIISAICLVIVLFRLLYLVLHSLAPKKVPEDAAEELQV